MSASRQGTQHWEAVGGKTGDWAATRGHLCSGYALSREPTLRVSVEERATSAVEASPAVSAAPRRPPLRSQAVPDSALEEDSASSDEISSAAARGLWGRPSGKHFLHFTSTSAGSGIASPYQT